MATFRMLSLGGGGLMGAFSAAVLATLERATDRRADPARRPAGRGQKIIDTFMFGQAPGAVAQATCLLRDRFHRIDYLTEPRIDAMGDARIFTRDLSPPGQ